MFGFFLVLFAQLTFAQNTEALFDVEVKSAGAVCEKSTSKVTFQPDGSLKAKNEFEFKVQTEAGRTALGLREVPFSPDVTEIQNLTAFSQTNGQLAKTPRSEMIERSESTDKTGIKDVRKIIIPFNSIKVGSTISYNYTESMKKPLIPNIAFVSAKYGDEFPERNSVLEITSMKPLRTTVLDNDNLLEIQSEQKAGTYNLTIKNKKTVYKIPELKNLALVPSGQIPMVFVTNAAGWNEIAKPLAEKYEAAINGPLPPAFQNIVKEASSQKNETEKLKFVLSSVSKLISYSGNWTTQAGMVFPKGHKQVVSEGKGDCKDFAVSTTAILRNLGFDANVALAISSNPVIRILKDVDYKTLVPTPDYFNHAVVLVKTAGGKQLWLDATNPVTLVDGIWPSIASSPALVLKTDTNELVQIPESLNVSTTTLTRTAKKESADQASWVGDFKADGFYATEVVELQTMHGKEKLESLLPTYLLKQSASKNSKIPLAGEGLKASDGTVSIAFNTLGQSPLADDKDKIRLRIDIDPSLASVFRANEKTGVYFGPPAKLTNTTTYENIAVEDAVMGDCFVLSDWLTFERKVSSKGPSTIVEDVIQIKKPYLTSAEASNLTFGYFLNDLRTCLGTPGLVVQKDAAIAKPLSAKDPKKIHELAIDANSGSEAERFFRIANGGEYQYTALKAKRIFEKQIEVSPKNFNARVFHARAVMRIGYLFDEQFQKSYVDAALAELDAVIKENPKEALAYSYRGRLLSSQAGKHSQGLTDAGMAYKLDPNSSLGRLSMAKVYLNLGNLPLAESWLRSGKDVAKGDLELADYWALYQDLGKLKKDAKMMIEARTQLANLDPTSPWVWHNLANALHANKETDKAIEMERKALSIANFGAAQKSLAIFIAFKFYEQTKDANKETIAKDRKLEEMLLEAQKADPTNTDILEQLTSIYILRVKYENETDWLDKADIHLAEGLKLEPKNEALLGQAKRINALKTELMAYFKKRGIQPSGRWPASFR